MLSPDPQSSASQPFVGCEPLESRRLLSAGVAVKINFQPDDAPASADYVMDAGQPFGPRADGLAFGWDKDVSNRARHRAAPSAPGSHYEDFIAPGRTNWGLAVPNGTYLVRVAAGDGKSNRRAKVDVEGVRAIDAKTTKADRWVEGNVLVTVTDGVLTVSPGDNYKNNRLAFIEVLSAVGGSVPNEFPDRPGDVTGLALVDTSVPGGRDVGPLADSATLDLATLGQAVGVRATIGAPEVGSVLFALDGVPYRVENEAPYHLGGKDLATGTPLARPPGDGPHTLTVTAYSQPDAAGTAGQPLTVAFTVTGSAGPAIDPHVVWTPGATVPPSTRVEGGVAHVGTKLYVMGGYVNGFKVDNTTDVFDAATGTWSRGPDFPGAQTHAGVASDGVRYVYKVSGQLGDGVPGTPTAEGWVLDTQTNQWSPLPAIPEARYAPGLAHVDGKLHLFGGTRPDRTTVVADHLVLDLGNPAAGWRPAAPLPEPGDHLSVAVIDGKIYAIGGEHGHAARLPEGDAAYVQHPHLLRYDPKADAWTELADVPVGRSHAEGTTLVVNGKILLMGGKLNATDVSGRADLYDPATNAWTTLNRLPRVNQGGAAIFHDGKIYLSHGQKGAPEHTMYRYTWTGTVRGI